VPSLAVLTALTLITFAGHAWVNRRSGLETAEFADGLYLGLVGHLFLLFVSTNPAWSIPPWPIFGTLTALTLTASAVSLLTERRALHVAAVAASGTIVAVWTYAAGPSWSLVGIVASAATSVFALLWIPIDKDRAVPQGAAVALFAGELTTIIAAHHRPSFPFAIIIAAHVLNLSTLLALTFIQRWRGVCGSGRVHRLVCRRRSNAHGRSRRRLVESAGALIVDLRSVHRIPTGIGTPGARRQRSVDCRRARQCRCCSSPDARPSPRGDTAGWWVRCRLPKARSWPSFCASC
jgi:hypothetical protein